MSKKIEIGQSGAKILMIQKSGQSYMPKIEKSHNFDHSMFCSETCCMVSTNIPPGGVERIFQKFLWEGDILAAVNVI